MSLIDARLQREQIRGALRIRAAIGISFFVVGGCASRDESLGCAELVVSCPAGGEAEQQWWLTKTPSSGLLTEIQGRQCGSWLAYIENTGWARYDNVDLGTREGEMRLRVVVSADDRFTKGGTLTLLADAEPTPVINNCTIPTTGGWFNWLVVDCGELPLRGVHSLLFQFGGNVTDPYLFNFAAFGVARRGSPDCSVTGPKHD